MVDRDSKVMAIQAAGHALRDAGDTLTSVVAEHVHMLHAHREDLRGLDTDIRTGVAALHREVSAERQIAEHRHLTSDTKQDQLAERLEQHGARLGAVESKLDQVLARLGAISAQLGMNGSGGAHG